MGAIDKTQQESVLDFKAHRDSDMVESDGPSARRRNSYVRQAVLGFTNEVVARDGADYFCA